MRAKFVVWMAVCARLIMLFVCLSGQLVSNAENLTNGDRQSLKQGQQMGGQKSFSQAAAQATQTTQAQTVCTVINNDVSIL